MPTYEYSFEVTHQANKPPDTVSVRIRAPSQEAADQAASRFEERLRKIPRLRMSPGAPINPIRRGDITET